MHDPFAPPDDATARQAAEAADAEAAAAVPDSSAPAAEAPSSGPPDPVAETAAVAEIEAPATPVAAAPAIAELSPAACAARLAALFPALFKGTPKPLKLRIQADIQLRAPGVFTRRSLSAFLHRHTTTTAYLVALSQATERFDLDGAPVGELADEHQQAAIAELERRRALHAERRAAEHAARRAAEAQARQAFAAADQARRERALLLRAFETSTLTRANFCALKRIAEAELDALLATARQEASQAAVGPAFEQRPDAQRRRDTRGGPADHRPRPRPRPDGGPRRPPADKPPR